MQEDKKRNNFSFSLKKNDNPLIKDFINEQRNCSESIRYLILKYCLESGVHDVSNKLTELLLLGYENNNNSTKNTIKEEITVSTEDNSVDIEKSNDKVEESKSGVIKENNNNNDDDDDIPECFKYRNK